MAEELDSERTSQAEDVSTLSVLSLHSTDLLTLLDERGIVRYESPR